MELRKNKIRSKIGVVIPSFDSKELLEKCLESVRDASENQLTKIVVVDNHPDGIDELHSGQADSYIPLPNNPGFGAACNLGISSLWKDLEIEWFLLINPDAQVSLDFFDIFNSFSKKNSISPISPLICLDHEVYRFNLEFIFENNLDCIMVVDAKNDFMVFNSKGEGKNFENLSYKRVKSTDHLVLKPDKSLPQELVILEYDRTHSPSKHKLVQIEPHMLIQDFIVQNAGSEIFSPFAAGDLKFGWLASAVERFSQGKRRAWCGAGVLIPRAYLELIGGFDETFFLYYEDTEMSYRGLTYGIYTDFKPELRIIHKHSAATNRVPKLRKNTILESRQIFITRTSGFMVSLLFVVGTTVRFITLVLTKRTTIKHFTKYFLPEIKHMIIGFFKSLFRKPKIVRFG